MSGLVTQADRNAAADWYLSIGRRAFASCERRGVSGDSPLVQAFAAHRIASQAELLEALSFIVAELDITYPDKHRMRDAATAAIAKARGQ